MLPKILLSGNAAKSFTSTCLTSSGSDTYNIEMAEKIFPAHDRKIFQVLREMRKELHAQRTMLSILLKRTSNSTNEEHRDIPEDLHFPTDQMDLEILEPMPLPKILKPLGETQEELLAQRAMLLILLRRTGDSTKQKSAGDLPVFDFHFPLTNPRDLKKLELKLDDRNVEKQALNKLSAIRGSSVNVVVPQLLNYMLSPTLAMLYNWTGKGMSRKKAFSDLKLRYVLFDAVRQNAGTSKATEYKVESITKRWFQRAGARYQKLQKRISIE
uniref:DUF4806 domain-containing protein n=1 Tax=Strigamia maritima TaxID=126957 RepID=T1J9R4_STRMM